MEKKIKKGDVILIIVILLAAVVFLLGMQYYQKIKTKEAEAVVTIGGVEYDRFPLTQDITKKIELPDGSYNVLKIKDGKADVTEASCPDGICVKHWSISRQGETIVCLPNELVVEIENGEEPMIDAIVN